MASNSTSNKRPRPRTEKKITPLKSWDLEAMVSLYAAEDESAKPLNIHKDVAIHWSPVLKRAFASEFEEGLTQSYRFEDVGQRVVRGLIHWMYQQELSIGTPTRANKSITDKLLIDLWVLADRLIIPTLQNVCIRELEKQRKRFKTMSTSLIPHVYERTGPDSPLRNYFLHWEMLLDFARLMVDNMPEDVSDGKKNRDIESYEVDEVIEVDEDEEMGG